MAGKAKAMSQIKQLLRLHEQGNSIKSIARNLGISKNTVKAYLAKLSVGKLAVSELLDMDDPILKGNFHAGNPAYKDPRFEHMSKNLEYYSNELKEVGVSRTLLYEEYISGYKEGYSYSQFCFHLRQQLIARRPGMRLEHLAGDKLFIDFAGKPMHYIDRGTGELIPCQIFVATLPFSDYCFAMAVRSQRVDDFLYALECCLREIGGAPAVLVPDNLKSAVVKTDRFEPEINRALEDFANYYSITVIPARPRKPKDKALVENQVKLVYNRVYARLRNRQFFDIESLNIAIREKVKAHNQTRMQQKPYCREERFLAAEKHLLKSLPSEGFEVKYYAEPKVANNNHIYLGKDKHYYSVPFAFVGTKVQVIYTRSMVRIYARGKQIALHIRNMHRAGYSTQKEHLSSHHRHYLERSPEYYIARAKEKSPELYMLTQLIFGQPSHPEQLYRTCDGLLRLQKTALPDAFAAACELAIEYRNFSYRFVERILKNNMTNHQDLVKPDQSLPEHQNIRGSEYYSQSTLKF
ncbi:transposase [Pedobacter sp. PACM 27299]|uniref:IS21 family transposase n=1 Tax=Pedobacter sp. PACM 27299 TaxID=1727164 RepID=UPI0007060312|nr:IS21 family transposase [Pedobacter sp. PACM 27299]ALL05457.1 transposase [Pedobacter sp. PACM 27299]ALL06280.1 transposase [Pedobacter sp. PACM 27299]ALL06414.1 transposase [Pedobacter sp. PACM 27299]